jgi:hypothetical protein
VHRRRVRAAPPAFIIERMQGPWWHWLFVGGILVLLSAAGISKRFEFESQSRARGCVSNQNSIDKAMRVWESQNVPLPVDRDLWIDIGTDGRIARVSADVEALQARLPVAERSRLARGSSVLFDLIKDHWVFWCPTRVNQVASHVGWDAARERSLSRPEVHYRWVSSSTSRADLGSPRRTCCMLYGRHGVREDPDARHALWTLTP